MPTGLDLARTRDFAALALLEQSDGYLGIRVRIFCPQGSIADKEDTDKIPLSAWINDGHVIATHRDEIDIDVICETIVAAHRRWGIEDLGYDPYNAGTLVGRLRREYGIICTAVPQTMPSKRPASAEFERRLASGEIRHERYPCLTWMVGNAVSRSFSRVAVGKGK